MARDRNENREKVREQRLELKNSFDKDDPTPMLAVKRINDGGGLRVCSGEKRADQRFMP